MKKTEQKVIKFISENNLLTKGEKVLIAISGGPDSVFLLHFINKFKKKFDLQIGAAHINHLLRGNNSDRDELFCREICHELGIEFFSSKIDVNSIAKKQKLSIEVAARNVRYNFFEEIVKKYNYIKILTAHNADDNVETVLLNLIKGTGLKGITGIPVKRGNIIRPILCLSKAEIIEYLEQYQYEYRVDESNSDNMFERNFLRNEIIPLIKKRLNPSLSNSVLTTSLNLQSINSELESNSEKIKTLLKVDSADGIRIPVNIILSNPLNAYFIKEYLEEHLNIKMESTDLKKIVSLIKKESGKSEELKNGLIAQKNRDLIVVRKNIFDNKQIDLKIKIGKTAMLYDHTLLISRADIRKIKFTNKKNTEYISADNIKSDFIVRNWKDGDRFYPFGMKGTKKVSDYLNNIKTGSFEKKKQLVLESKGNIIWIIGQRIDERYKVTKNTKKVLKLCLN